MTEDPDGVIKVLLANDKLRELMILSKDRSVEEISKVIKFLRDYENEYEMAI